MIYQQTLLLWRKTTTNKHSLFQVPPQPISLSGTRAVGRQLNNRKLAELPYHLLTLQDWDRFEQQIATLEFVEAKFEAGQGTMKMDWLIPIKFSLMEFHILATSKVISGWVTNCDSAHSWQRYSAALLGD